MPVGITGTEGASLFASGTRIAASALDSSSRTRLFFSRRMAIRRLTTRAQPVDHAPVSFAEAALVCLEIQPGRRASPAMSLQAQTMRPRMLPRMIQKRLEPTNVYGQCTRRRVCSEVLLHWSLG